MKFYTQLLALLLCAITSIAQTMDVAYVRKGKDWRLIDTKGNFLTESLFEHDSLFIDCPDEGMVLTEKAGKYGFYDLDAKRSIANVYDSAGKFYHGLCQVKKDGKWFLIDKNGNQAVYKKGEEPTIDAVKMAEIDNTDSLEALVHNDPHQFIAPWNDVNAFTSNRILCYQILANKNCSCHKMTNYYGFINRKAEWVIHPDYEWADIYSLGLAAVSQGSGDEMSIGYIDMDGKWVIQPLFQDCRRFRTIKIK